LTDNGILSIIIKKESLHHLQSQIHNHSCCWVFAFEPIVVVADVLGLGEFGDSLCRFLVNRVEPIEKKGGVDFILKQALEIKNAGYDVDYFVDEAMQNGSKWLNAKTNGKSTKKAETDKVYMTQKTAAELDAEIERMMEYGY
jgi:hypothetical protein